MRTHRDRHRFPPATWSLAALEPRLMLAADAGAAAETMIVADNAQAAPAEAELNSPAPSHLVFVDAKAAELTDLVEQFDGDYRLILLNENRSGIQQISAVLSKHSNVASVHLLAHGESGKLAVGNEVVDQQTLRQQQQQVRCWSRSLAGDADILIYGCHTGAGEAGRQFVDYLAELTGADVAASIDATGHASQGGDWDLEQVAGTVEATLAISHSQRQQYQGVLPITIRAAGSTNEEQMLLQVDGTTVATYDNVGGDATAGIFQQYTYDVDAVSPEQVRIVFTNDLWDPANGIDRNLRVDSITIDGATYQTEHPAVYSTGTYLPADGIVPGFRQSEYLNGDGYFQYADPNGNENEGSVIDIRALGDEGTEQFNLQIDGLVVAVFAADTDVQDFSYTAAGLVTADQVRIEFTNDRWDPANGIDTNLTIDWIEIDEARFETESPDVYSTGTWTATDAIVPGFGRGDTLHTSGYFQYAEPSVNENDGSIIDIRAVGAEGTEQFNLQIDGQVVALFSATTGLQTYSYTAAGTVTPDQVRVAFTNDLWDPANGIDSNLTVDWIEVDGLRVETESPDIFSTGTWNSADGMVPGFGRGDTLHANGYFQYAPPVPGIGDGEIWVLESVAYAGQYMRLDEVGGNVRLSTTIDPRSMWRVADAGQGSSLQNVATGQYLDADGTADGGNIDVSPALEADDIWTIVDNGAAGLTLQNVDTNGYIDGDSLAEGGNIDQSLLVGADDYWRQTIIADPDTRALPDAAEVTFASFGDYGAANPQAPLISSLVHQLNADLIVTLGDARYDGETYAGVHGAFYPYYLNGAEPSDDAPTGGTSSINRFFPAAGNHDYDDGGGINEFLDYFSLPGSDVPSSGTGNELYYDFVWGPAHFFVIDSEAFQNSPTSQTTQTAWLQSQLQASLSPWQIVVMHHPPYSSGGDHGSTPALQLDYAQWGADLVLAGHDHDYERLQRDGITYVVSGVGGKSIRQFGDTETGSLIRYNDDYGISLFTASETQIIGSFVSLDGVVQDSFVIDAV